MKETELRKHAICDNCKKPIGHTQLPLFWTVTIDRWGIDLQAMRRQSGLSMLLGSTNLAQVMGADEDMATRILGPVELTLCEECALGDVNLAVLAFDAVNSTAK